MATQKTAASTKETAPDMAPVKKIVPSSILTIDADSEIETPESRKNGSGWYDRGDLLQGDEGGDPHGRDDDKPD